MNADINKVMLTLDIDLEVVNFAVNNNIDLIITHHPFLFSTLKSIDYSTYEGKVLKELIKNSINLYSMHTNFDMAEYGVNQKLAEILNITDYEILHVVNKDLSGYGGIGKINSINIKDYAREVKTLLKAEHIKLYCNDLNKIIERVAFCGGSGSDFINDAIDKNAHVYITGDIKYHQAQLALNNDLCIIDAGHYYTEYHSLENVKLVLEKETSINVTLLEKNTVNETII